MSTFSLILCYNYTPSCAYQALKNLNWNKEISSSNLSALTPPPPRSNAKCIHDCLYAKYLIITLSVVGVANGKNNGRKTKYKSISNSIIYITIIT